VDWCKELFRQNKIAVFQETFIRSSQVTNHGSVLMRMTQEQSTVWDFEDEPNPTKLVRGRRTSKQVVACFFGKTGPVATVPLEQWFAWILQRNSSNEQERTDHCAPWQCEISHISSSQRLLDRPKRRIDVLSAV